MTEHITGGVRLNELEISPGDLGSSQLRHLKAAATQQLFGDPNHPLGGIIHERHALWVGSQKGLFDWKAVADRAAYQDLSEPFEW